jgi:hypothetical protein
MLHLGITKYLNNLLLLSKGLLDSTRFQRRLDAASFENPLYGQIQIMYPVLQM